MSRKWSLTIAGIALVAVCAVMWGLWATKPQQPSARAADAVQAQQKPFRSAVVELTFRSRSVHEGAEHVSETGHRIEYIDVAGGRRREDYNNNRTIIQQFTSSEALTWIFDGSDYYVVSDKEGKRTGHVTEMRRGYDYPIWADAMVEKLVEEFPGQEPRSARKSFWGGLARSTPTQWSTATPRARIRRNGGFGTV